MKYSTRHSFAFLGTIGWTLAGIACSAAPTSSGGSTGAGVGGSATNTGGSPGYQTGDGGSGAAYGTSNSVILCSGTACTWSPAPANGQILQDNGNTMLLCGIIRDVHSTFPDVEPCTNNPGSAKLCDSSDYVNGINGGVEQNPTPSDPTQCCGNISGSLHPNSCFVQTTIGSDTKPQYVSDANKQQNGTVTTTGAANFHFRYNTDTNVDPTVDPANAINWAAPLCLALAANNDGTGTYTYQNRFFFPIDDKLFGPEGQTDDQGTPHNYGFMTEFHVTFTYEAGQLFKFNGDDDMIVFINQQLVVDRSGIHNAEEADLNLDGLNLAAGQDYQMDIFYNERHRVYSEITVSTSMKLNQSVLVN